MISYILFNILNLAIQLAKNNLASRVDSGAYVNHYLRYLPTATVECWKSSPN